MQEENTQKGIRFEASFGQFLSALLLVALLFGLPVGGYEYLSSLEEEKTTQVYTASSLQSQGRTVDSNGRVAGVSVNNQEDGLVETVGILFESNIFLYVVGVVLILFASFMTFGLVFDFLKK